ncbi:hypothetical protein AB4Y64_13240 [Lysobacter sp. TAF61]|uniref:DUF7665 family protein n=1 Tax=Lysobacter sp. TAF61 TaxID=3233072 RepID=UPI003F95399A
MNTTPGDALLDFHLHSGRFLTGVAGGRWKLLDQLWPFVQIAVTAGDGRQFVLRFDCTGYPDQAPTARLWDATHQHPLPVPQWPRGGRVSQMFNPGWKDGAVYIPCDRQAIEGHNNWFADYPWLIWNPDIGLVQYIQAVHETLNSAELQHETA